MGKSEQKIRQKGLVPTFRLRMDECKLSLMLFSNSEKNLPQLEVSTKMTALKP